MGFDDIPVDVVCPNCDTALIRGSHKEYPALLCPACDTPRIVSYA